MWQKKNILVIGSSQYLFADAMTRNKSLYILYRYIFICKSDFYFRCKKFSLPEVVHCDAVRDYVEEGTLYRGIYLCRTLMREITEGASGASRNDP